jgi:hypothetical protein
MNIIIDLSNIMYNDLWMWNKTKLKRSPSTVFSNRPQPQIRASNSNCSQWLNHRSPLSITSWYRLSRKHNFSVAVQLLLSGSMTYSSVVCAAISMDCAENAIFLFLIKGRCLVTASCCDSTILALSEFVLLYLHYITSQKIILFITIAARNSNPTKLYLFRSFQY